MVVLDATHPITKGVTDFQVYDEQHFTFIDEHRGAKVTTLLQLPLGLDKRACGQTLAR